jgi:hypothetical protein
MDKTQSNVKIKGGLAKTISSVFFVLITIVLNGFLTFLEFDFDFRAIKTVAFWIAYLINISSAIVIFFMIYILRKQKNLKNVEIIKRVEKNFEYIDKIQKFNKIKASDIWLRRYYNEHLRIDKLERKLRAKLSWFVPKEPRAVKEKTINKIFLRFYIYKIKRFFFEIKEARRDKILRHIELLEVEREKLNNLMPNEKIDEVLSSEFKAMIKGIRIKEVTFDALRANEFGYDSAKRNTPYTKEKTALMTNLVWGILFGVVFMILLTSFKDVFLNKFDAKQVYELLMKAFTFTSYGVRGLFTADNFIFYEYVSALDNRENILIELSGYLGLLEDPIEKTTREKEVELIEKITREVEKRFEIVE